VYVQKQKIADSRHLELAAKVRDLTEELSKTRTLNAAAKVVSKLACQKMYFITNRSLKIESGNLLTSCKLFIETFLQAACSCGKMLIMQLLYHRYHCRYYRYHCVSKNKICSLQLKDRLKAAQKTPITFNQYFVNQTSICEFGLFINSHFLKEDLSL
jgi:hypothetical protein